MDKLLCLATNLYISEPLKNKTAGSEFQSLSNDVEDDHARRFTRIHEYNTHNIKQ